jgi:penicillin-binding protein 1A
MKRFRERHPGLTRTLALAFSFLVAFGVGFAYASWALVCRAGRCPSENALEEYEPRQTSKLYAADGRYITELGLERRTLIKIDDIPPMVRQAFIVTEDRRFYQHTGIDWRSVPRAVLVDIKNRDFSEGFSTITMQLARNIFPERLSRDKSPIRKLKEAKVARAIEAKYSKDRILELYLNQINFGNGAYGIETAAQRYFGKPVKDLNIAEAATLAALPKGPARYNPRIYPDRAIQRRNTIIGLMRDAGIITPAEAREAQAYPLRLATRVDAGEIAPYFVEWIRQQLDDKFGRQLYEQGLKVYTTLDLDMQSAAERALERQIRSIESGKFGSYTHPTYERYLAQVSNEDQQAAANSPYLQGAFIALDPHTGAVRALVGGRDFDDSKFNRAVQAVRQPGSTFKPIVYADAIQNGRPLSYILEDSALSLDLGNGQRWEPKNYESNYLGPIPMRRALYQSRNIPTIRLGLELGVQSVIDEARKFGITTPIPGYPSIFIGAADVYPIEMVAAYSVFANLGNRVAPIAITRVEDQKGNVLWEPRTEITPVMSPEESWLMVSVMKDVVRRGTAAGSVGSQISFPAGGKTGTTNDGTNVWFIGYTSDIVAGVWMGFDRPQKIKANAQGGTLAAPVDGVHERGLQAQARTARLAHAARAHPARDRRHDQHARLAILPAQRGRHRVFHPRHRSDHPVRRAHRLYLGHDRNGRALSAGNGSAVSSAAGAAAPRLRASRTAAHHRRGSGRSRIAAARGARHLPPDSRLEHLCTAAARHDAPNPPSRRHDSSRPARRARTL